MPAKLREVIYLYGEPNLQKTVKVNEGATVSASKAKGMEELSKLLSALSGLGKIEIDPDCTDIYPVPTSENVKLRDMDGNITMVMYPKGNIANRTPSPITAALTRATTALRAHGSQKIVQSLLSEPTAATVLKQKPGDAKEQSGPLATTDSQNSDLLSRLDAVKLDNVVLKSKLDAVELESAELRRENSELQKAMVNTMDRFTSIKIDLQTVLDGRVAANHVRRCALLDLACEQLAQICGFCSWKDWKAQVTRDQVTRESMVGVARAKLTPEQPEFSAHWIALANQASALDVLVLPNLIQRSGEPSAHPCSKNLIEDSILSMPVSEEKDAMMAIFLAYYNQSVSLVPV